MKTRITNYSECIGLHNTNYREMEHEIKSEGYSLFKGSCKVGYLTNIYLHVLLGFSRYSSLAMCAFQLTYSSQSDTRNEPGEKRHVSIS